MVCRFGGRVSNRNSVARNCAESHTTILKLRAMARNFAQLHGIVRNYAELRAIFLSLQGSQLCASKIHLGWNWKPILEGCKKQLTLKIISAFFQFLLLN